MEIKNKQRVYTAEHIVGDAKHSIEFKFDENGLANVTSTITAADGTGYLGNIYMDKQGNISANSMTIDIAPNALQTFSGLVDEIKEVVAEELAD